MTRPWDIGQRRRHSTACMPDTLDQKKSHHERSLSNIVTGKNFLLAWIGSLMATVWIVININQPESINGMVNALSETRVTHSWGCHYNVRNLGCFEESQYRQKLDFFIKGGIHATDGPINMHRLLWQCHHRVIARQWPVPLKLKSIVNTHPKPLNLKCQKIHTQIRRRTAPLTLSPDTSP